MVARFEVDPDKTFQRAIQDALKQVDDLTIPLTLISQSWFKSNQAIFALKGPGKYEDLSENYKPQKKAAVGFVYPILKRSGALARSITQPGAEYSISELVNKTTLLLGSSIPYGATHQFGRGKIPARPWVLIGAEQTAPAELNKRRDAWVEMIGNYVLQKVEGVGEVRA